MTKITRNLAIIIGINDYEHIPKLKNAVADATELAKVLKNNYNYTVLELFDEEATTEKFSELLTNLENKKIQVDGQSIQFEKTDRLLFYFAGHGFAEEAEDNEEGKPAGYFMPQDAENSNDNKTWLSMQKLYEAFTNLDCHHLLMILDCCFAGRISWIGKGRNVARPRKFYQQSYDRFIKYSTQQIITSAAHDEKAQDSFRFGKRGEKNGHSPFSHFLLKILKADSNGGDDKFIEAIIDDKVITAQELFTYIQNELGKVAEGQTPDLFKPRKKENDQYVFLKGEYIFPLKDFKPENLEKLELDESTNPYKGLASFEAKDSQLFFGRKRLIEGSNDQNDPENKKDGLISTVKKKRLTVVLGVSGSGKSSLVKAGLIPKLRSEEKKQASQEQWYVLAPIRPGEVPLTALARAFLPIKNINLVKELNQVQFLDNLLSPKIKQQQEAKLNDESKKKFNILVKAWSEEIPEVKLLLILDHFEQLKQICNASEEQLLEKFKNDISNTLDSLIKELKQNPQLLIKIVNQWSKNNPNIKLLLTIDQSEELITLCKNDQDREDFLRLLAETLASPDLSEKLHIVLTLRSDFEPQIRDLNQDKYKQETWQDVWQKGRFIVTPMNREELQQVIEEPAAQRTLFFESPKLVNALIDEVLQMPGALPLLSFTLSKLYLRYLDAEKKYCVDETTGRNDRTITEADYKDIGGVPRSLTNTANDTYTQLEKKEKVNESRIRDVMLRMVAISGGELARRRVPTSELVYPEPKNEQVQRVIDGFLAARLLVKGLDNEGQEYVEPVHDALVRGWGKIKNWLEERQKYASNHSFWQFFTRKSIRQNRLLEEERPLKINLFLQRELTTAANHWQRQKEEANERQAFGFLWDSDPRLEQLKQIQRSQDGWFNALEDRFVTHSLRRKRNNFIRLIGSIVLVSLGIYGTARFGESQATRSSITALIDSSKNALNSNQQLEAFIASVKAGKELEQMNRGIGVGGHIQNMLDSTRWAEIDFKTITTLHQVLAQIQEKNRLEGHSDEVNSVVFCPSNANSEVKSLIATASDDNTVKLWQPNGQLIKTSQTLQHSSPITSVSFSPDCQILASASLNGNIKLWKLDKTQKSENIQVNLKQELSISGLITSVSVSPDGKMIATASFGPTGSDKGQINIWTIEGKRLKTFDGQEYDFRTDNFSRLSFSANSQLIALASLNGIKLWNLETLEGEPLKPINIDDKQVRSVSFSPDGKTLASANRNGQIKLWNLDGTPIREWDSHSEPIYQIIFSPDGKMIASGSDDNLLKLWNLEGTSLETFSGHSGSVTSLSFSKDSQTLFSSSLDGTVKVWDINPHWESLGVKVWKHNQKDKIVAGVFLSEPSMSLDNNEPTLAFIDGEGKAYLWDVDSRTWKPLQQKPDERLGRISFSPDEQTFVSVSEDLQNLTLWSRKGKRLTSLLDLIDDEFIVEAHFHPQQNNLLAVASSKTIKLWKLEHNALTFWKELKELKKLGEHETLEAIRFSPNGKYLVSAGQDNIIRLWTFDGQLIDQQKGFGNSKMLRFSPNSKFLAFLDSTDHQEIIKLWNLEQRKDIKTLEGHEQPVSSIRFSQDSKTLASASKDRTIRLWNSQGENLQSFIGNRSAIADVIFHPDDQMLASLSSSISGNAEIHVINLWSREGEEIGTLEHPQAQEITTIRFSEDGQKIVATSIDPEGLVILWDLDRKHLLKLSCQWLHNYLNNKDNNVQPEERNLCP